MSSAIILTISATLSALTSIVLTELAQVDIAVAALAGALAFLAAFQVRTAVLQTHERNRTLEALHFLRATDVSLTSSLEQTKKNMTDVTTALAQRTEAQEKKLTGELQIIERLIREFAGNIKKSKEATPPESQIAMTPSSKRLPYAHTLAEPAMLELIRSALEENRVDLYLQPVVNLPQRRVRFYEALTRLRSADGAIIMPSQYIKVAAPAGLMSVIDNLLLFRCVQIVRRLAQKSRDLAIFCNISRHTLGDAEFFPQFLEFLSHARDLASQIVFEFSQDCVLQARPAEEANLKALADLGFRLSIDQVTKLNCNFTKLKRLGFHFLKVKASTLISGMCDAQAMVPAEDFKDLLARNGISLIVERIEDEKEVVQLLEYNVDFGQGYLFGQPRPLRDVGEVHDPRAKEQSASNVTLLSPGLTKRLAG